MLMTEMAEYSVAQGGTWRISPDIDGELWSGL